MLLKMARQLNAMDEASLMALWNKYLQRVQDFDASREWEEAAIVLSLLQAVRGKNQLFNTKWEEREAMRKSRPEPKREDLRPWRRMEPREKEEEKAPAKKATVLAFRSKKS